MNLLNAWLSGVLIILSGIIALFPDADASVISTIENGLTPFKTAISSANWFFPVDTFFAFLAVVFTIEFTLLTVKTVGWIAHNITLGFFKN